MTMDEWEGKEKRDGRNEEGKEQTMQLIEAR